MHGPFLAPSGHIQIAFGEDGMDVAFIERRSFQTLVMNDHGFEHQTCVNVTNFAGRFLPGVSQVGVDDS
jgi:hypothetical protein